MDDYRRYVLPHSRAVIERIRPGVPVIHFATGNPALVPLLSEAGGSVIGVDWRLRLDDAGADGSPRPGLAGQSRSGRALCARGTKFAAASARCSSRSPAGRGYIANLGHGVLPHTPVDNVLAMIDAVHNSQLTAAGMRG